MRSAGSVYGGGGGVRPKAPHLILPYTILDRNSTVPLISRVQGPYGKLWTVFFPSFYDPSKFFSATFPIAIFTISHTLIMEKASFSCPAIMKNTASMKRHPFRSSPLV